MVAKQSVGVCMGLILFVWASTIGVIMLATWQGWDSVVAGWIAALMTPITLIWLGYATGRWWVAAAPTAFFALLVALEQVYLELSGDYQHGSVLGLALIASPLLAIPIAIGLRARHEISRKRMQSSTRRPASP